MSSMFWGLRLEPGKRYSTTVDKSFHVSMAALDCTSAKSDTEVHSVMIEDGETNVPFILCNLQKTKLLQSTLDLNFMTGDRITIFCKGSGVIHLSGYIIPEDDELAQLEEDDDEEGEEEEEEDETSDKEETLVTKGKKKINGLQTKRKPDETIGSQTKKKKLVNLDEDSDDTDEDDDIASDDNEDENMGLEGEESDDDDDEDDDDEEDDDEEDDDDEDDSAEEEEEEEKKMPSKALQQAKKNKKNKAQLQKPTSAVSNKQQNQLNTSSGKQQNQGKQQKTPNGLSPNLQTKKDKKKVDKATIGSAANSNAKLNKSNDDSITSLGAKKGGEEASPGKKMLDGGVMVKDTKIGNGPLCKSGKMVTVYYTGRFKQNNKVFDSTNEGTGFKFRVGKGDVIKGWDVGVVGMKVGGKRLITCPPHMAYGQKGSPPTIPPNSTLVFEVELKNVN